MDKVSLTRLAIMIKYTAGELKNFRGNCPLEKEEKMGNAFNSNQLIPKMDADDGDQIEVSAVGRCGYFGYFAIDGCFLLAVDIFASSDGYDFVTYAGGGLVSSKSK